MNIFNLLENSSFETGDFSHWKATNATITANHSHTGLHSVKLGNMKKSNLSQKVTVEPEQSYQLLLSLSKIGIIRSPKLKIKVEFLDDDNQVLKTGLKTIIETNRIPNFIFKSWLHIYELTEPAPKKTNKAKVTIETINKEVFSSYILVDDVQLLNFKTSNLDIDLLNALNNDDKIN